MALINEKRSNSEAVSYIIIYFKKHKGQLKNRHIINCNGYGHHNKISNGIYSTEPDTTNYYIDHFYCKSMEEFIRKINRGDPLFNTDKYKMIRIEKFFKQSILTKEKIEMLEKGTRLNLGKYKAKLNNS